MKIIAFILFVSSMLFANEHRTHTYVYVTHSKPVYEYRHNRVYNQCDDDDDYYYNNSYNDYEDTNYYRNNNNHNTIGLDTIVGATIGVAIGNQIGKGNGRTVAKVAGGLLGANIANNARHDKEYKRYKKSHRNKHYNNCNDDSYSTKRTRVLRGYKNYFIYKNKEYMKFTKRAQDRIRVTKTISF